jgi:hypothetical protein
MRFGSSPQPPNEEGNAVMNTRNPIAAAATIATLMLAMAGNAQAAKETAGADAPSAARAPSSQQSKMATCNKEAGEKTLKGDERKKFMSGCLSSKKAAK